MTDEQIVEALATKVLGWQQVKFPALVTEAVDDGIVRFIVNSEGRIETRSRREDGWGNWEYFSPLTNPADSKMVRQKLAERWPGFNLSRSPHEANRGRPFQYQVFTANLTVADVNGPYAETEERAVAMCALQAVGVDPTPSPQ